MFKTVIIGIILLFSGIQMVGQCNVTVDVPQDITLCNQGSILLDGVINGSSDCHLWTSDLGYFNDLIIDPTIFIVQTTVFTFSAYGTDVGPNLIVNGDFEGGDSGFDTGYLESAGCVHSEGPLGCEGYYAVAGDPSAFHNNFSACAPNGGSQMMIVNGAMGLQDIWCQDVNVFANKKYHFSAWAQSVEPSSPAQLQFSIDGATIGNVISLSSSPCNWQEVTDTWISSADATVQICVTNQNTAIDGNDFALDDIFFAELCSDEKSFEVFISDLSIDPAPAGFIDCDNTSVTLESNPDGSSDPFSYSWFSPDGHLFVDQGDGTAIVDIPGEYTLVVTDQAGCTRDHSFFVDGSSAVPNINLEVSNNTLGCNPSPVTIINTLDESTYAYDWDLEGNYFSNDPNLEVVDPGFYELTVTDIVSNCTAVSNIEIFADQDPPNVTANFSNPIDCINSISNLEVMSTDNINVVSWYDEGGIEITGNMVSEGGLYSVTVIGENGCTASANVTVPATNFDPQINILPIDTLTCAINNVTLSLDLDPNLTINWLGPNQFSAIGNDIDVSEVGNYTATVSDANGCSTQVNLTVPNNIDPPSATTSNFGSLTCDIELIQINITDPNQAWEYSWTLPNGSVTTGQSVNVGTAGTIALEVTGENGCTYNTSLVVNQMGNLPTLNLSADTITCQQQFIDLQASGTYNNLEWSDQNGLISNLSVNESGWYYAYADNGFGCDLLDSIFVQVDTLAPILNVELGELNCLISSIDVYNNNQGEESYEWITPEGQSLFSDTLTVIDTGMYQVIATGLNGCSLSSNFAIPGNFMEPDFSVSGIQDLDCNIPETSIDITFIDEYVEYRLESPLGIMVNPDLPLVVDQAGGYSFQVLGTNGCSHTETMFIDVDTSSTTSFVSIMHIDCFNQEGMITVNNEMPDHSYFWNSNNTSDSSFSSTEGGSYVLTTINDLNGCESELQAEILVDTIAPIVAGLAGVVTCLQPEVPLSVIGENSDWNYTIENPDGEIFEETSITVSTAGQYLLTVTNPENGCTNEAFVIVNQSDDLPEIISYQIDAPDCDGTEFEFSELEVTGGIPPYTYNIESLGESMDIDASATLEAGTQNLVVEDSNGCSTSVNFELETNEALSIDLVDSISIAENETGQLLLTTNRPEEEIESINWTPSFGLSCNDCYSPTIMIEESTTFSVTVIDIFGCEQTIEVFVRFENSFSVFVPNLFTPSEESNETFYPFTTLETVDQVQSFSIFDRWGNKVFVNDNFNPNTPEEGWDGRIQGIDAEVGVYVYLIELALNNGEILLYSGDVTLIR